MKRMFLFFAFFLICRAAQADVIFLKNGEVVEVNEALVEDFELVSEPVNEKGWIVKVKVADTSALDALMNEAAYAEYLKEVD